MISSAEPWRLRSPLAVALALTALTALLLRVTSIAEPLGIDQSLWASAVRGMSRGQLLYQDVWEQRPPGIYWIYLAGFHVFGWTPATVAWLDLLAAACTTILLAAIVRPLASVRAALAAAALYAALTMPAWLYGYGGFLERSVSETFIVVCIAAAAWCAVQFHGGGALRYAAGLGLFAGAAVVFKPNAGLYFPALLLWTWLYRGGASPPTPHLARGLATAVAASAVLPLATLAWLWSHGLLHEARTAVVDFNRYYVGEGFSPGGYAIVFAKAVWLRMKTDPLWLAGSAGAVVAVWDLARRGRLPPMSGLAVIWGGAAALVIIVNGARLFNSYFINALPPLAIMAAWLLAEAGPATRARRLLAAAIALLMGVLLVQRDYAGRVIGWARTDAGALSGREAPARYLERFGGYANQRGYSARANAEVAAYVREHTEPDERVFLFGINGAGIYFASDRLTAHRFLRVNFFVETDFPDPSFRLEAVIRDLEEARPRYIIFERLNSASAMGQAADSLPRHPAVVQLLEAYHREAEIEDFTLYRRSR